MIAYYLQMPLCEKMGMVAHYPQMPLSVRSSRYIEMEVVGLLFGGICVKAEYGAMYAVVATHNKFHT